jgi:hypothetical protein
MIVSDREARDLAGNLFQIAADEKLDREHGHSSPPSVSRSMNGF